MTEPTRAHASASMALAALLRTHRGRVVALTGAGVSTASRIPDYRSPGRPPHRPMTEVDFLSSPAARARFWARSTLGWPVMSGARPCAAHTALAALARAGWLSSLITQNVDGLHAAAGTPSVIELHGSVHTTVCRACGAIAERAGVQARVERENDDWLTRVAFMEAAHRPKAADTDGAARSRARPDGDFLLLDPALTESFVPPACEACGERKLAPNVVFFGGSLSPFVAARAAVAVDEATALVVAGTTLSTLSSLRLVRAAAARGAPVIIINRGATRADGMDAVVKYEVDVGEALEAATSDVLR